MNPSDKIRTFTAGCVRTSVLVCILSSALIFCTASASYGAPLKSSRNTIEKATATIVPATPPQRGVDAMNEIERVPATTVTTAGEQTQNDSSEEDIRTQVVSNKKTQSKTVAKQKPEVKKPVEPEQQTKIRFIWASNRRFVMLQDVAAYHGLKFRYIKTGAELNGDNRIVFTFDKRNGSINGTNVFFLSPMIIKGGMAYISEQDFRLVIAPILTKSALTPHSVRTVMLDPGHGGQDNGATGAGGRLEKNLNLEMARKLKAKLQEKGYKVVMTRENDSFPSLSDRSDFAEKAKPDLFVSIHCNASTEKSINGIETFAMTPVGAASTSDTKVSQNIGSGNDFDKNNYRLAYEIQRLLIGSTKAEDRGVKHARFAVIRNSPCPAVLIETGFVSNPKESFLLGKKEYQDSIVSSIAAAIDRYAAAVKPAPKKK